ncbi:MAG: SURF1 family protein [Arenicellales bacterium]
MLRDYRFRPSWKVTLAALVVFPTLVGLGVWQLHRAKEAAEMRDHFRARSKMAALDINHGAPDPASGEFRRARVSGRYRADLTIYLDNKIMNGVPGYDILTPLAIADEKKSESGEAGAGGVDSGTGRRFILVNRGWISWGRSRETLPAVDTPGGPVVVSGMLKAPPAKYFTLQRHVNDKTFQPLWENLDLGRYRKVTGLKVSPLVLLLDPGDRQGGGFIRRWPRYNDPWVERHNGYATQWFSMAFILVVMYVGLNVEKRDTASD